MSCAALNVRMRLARLVATPPKAVFRDVFGAIGEVLGNGEGALAGHESSLSMDLPVGLNEQRTGGSRQ